MDDKLLENAVEETAVEEAVEPKKEDALDAVRNHPLMTHRLEDDEALAEKLQGEIALLADKEKVLTKKLCIAKEKGMHEQADRCRTLLQRVVLFRNTKKAELAEVQERIRKAKALAFMEKFSKEVDDLTNEIEEDLFGLETKVEEPDQEPLFRAEYDHRAKSKRLSFISSLFVWVGLLSGLLGAVAYLLLVSFHQTAFSWIEFSVFGIVIVAMIVVALIFGALSNRHKRLANEIEQEIAERQAEYEAECREKERLLEAARKISQIEDSDGIAEAYSIEKEGDRQHSKQERVQSLIADFSNPEKLKKVAKKALPIVAACAAVAALVIVGKRSKKKNH